MSQKSNGLDGESVASEIEFLQCGCLGRIESVDPDGRRHDFLRGREPELREESCTDVYAIVHAVVAGDLMQAQPLIFAKPSIEMSTPRRIGLTGNGFSSLQRTQDRSTRVVYSNTLTQQTRVQNGLAKFVVYEGTAGQGGPVNTTSIAQKTGAITLTVAERDAAIAAGSPST